jgi:hypothetical protein
MINWTQFESDLKSYFNSKRAKGENDAANHIADLYDRYVRFGKEQYGNSILTSNKDVLAKFIYLGFLAGRNGQPLSKVSERVSQGILLYWAGVTMQITIPPPGSIQSVSNVITFPGVPLNIRFSNTLDKTQLARNLTLGFKTHIITVMGVNTALVPVPGGGTVPTPFPWTGIK